MLVVPTVDDVFAFERELCGEGAALGGTVLTFGALFGQIATAAGRPPGAVLSPAQRRRCVEVAVEGLTGRLGPLRRSAGRPGFAAAFARLLDELAGGRSRARGRRGQRRDPGGLRRPAGVPPSSPATKRRASAAAASTPPGSRSQALALLRADPVSGWAVRSSYMDFYDLTPAQFDLVEALAARDRGHDRGAVRGWKRGAGGARGVAGTTARAPRADRRADGGPGRPRRTPRAPSSTRSPAASASRGPPSRPRCPSTPTSPCCARPGPGPRPRRLRRRFLAADPRRGLPGRDRGRPPRPWPARPGGRSGTGGERDRRGARGRGAGRVDLGRWGRRRAARGGVRGRDEPPTCSATCAAPRASLPAGSTGWSARSVVAGSATPRPALARWRGEAGGEASRGKRSADEAGGDVAGEAWIGEDPRDLIRLREAATESAAALCAAVAGLAGTMASRPFRDRRGRAAARPRRRAGAAGRRGDCRRAGHLAALGPLAPAPERLAETVGALDFRVGAGRSRAGCGSPAPTARAPPASTTSSSAPCRTASSRAATAAATPSSPRPSARASASTRAAIPKPRSATSSASASRCPAAASSSPTATATRTAPAESRSPLLEEVRALIAPRDDERAGEAAADGADPVEAAITRVRDSPTWSRRWPRRPPPTSFARALAAHAQAPTPPRCSPPWDSDASPGTARRRSASPSMPRQPRNARS